MAWDNKNLAHRYTQSFFISEYQESPTDVYREGVKLGELNFANILASNNANNLNIITAAATLIRFFIKNGIPPEVDKNMDSLYSELVILLADIDKPLENVADKMDEYFRFFNE